MGQEVENVGGITTREWIERKIRQTVVSGRQLAVDLELDAYRVGHSLLSLKTLITRIKAEEGLTVTE